MNKKSLYLSSIFLFCSSIFISTQSQEVKLLCLNECTNNPHIVYLFAHGVALRSNTAIKQALPYIDNNIIAGLCYTFDFGDSYKTLNLGQEPDCLLFINAYEQVRTKHPEAHIILVGISRGAVTILNSLALHAHLDWSPVKAAILESPYAHVTALAEQIANSYMFFIPFNNKLMRKLINSLPSYKHDGIQPIDIIGKITPSFPLFIAYSEADKTVPAAGTRMLIEKMQSAGHAITTWSTQKRKHSMLGTDMAFAQTAREFLKIFTV